MGLFTTSPQKDFPKFWTQYLAAFALEKSKAGFLGSTLDGKKLHTTRFVVFDTETTGLHYKEDRILSIGAVTVINNEISIAQSLELYLKQDIYKPESAKIHGILRNGSYEQVNEQEAIERCLEFIGTDILIGHHIGFDVAVINAALKRAQLGKLKNRVLDTETLYKRLVHPINRPLQEKRYTLDELAEALKIPLHDRHTSAGDAFITAIAFIKIVKRLNSDGSLTVKQLFRKN